ncbi:Uncharacterised protein [Klebsiella pneumoniae]|nr:Uncharacterised protein [Klebsiella pneumoniae]
MKAFCGTVTTIELSVSPTSRSPRLTIDMF